MANKLVTQINMTFASENLRLWPPPGPPPSSAPPPGPRPGVSWANVVNSNLKASAVETPMHLQREHFEKLKSSSKTFVTIDHDLWSNGREAMQTSLYAKFLGKSLSLDQTKLALADA